MAVVVRQMKVEDLEDVRRVDLLAWDDLVRRIYPEIPKTTSRTDANILSYLHTDGDGAVVAVDERAGIVGSSFSHIWGKTGWVGPLSVLPSYQGMGVGKMLLKSSLRYLEDRGCADIGLETLPEQASTLGLYLRVGLRPEGLVVVLGRSLEGHKPSPASAAVSIERFTDARSKDLLLARAKEISNSLHPGLDFSVEVGVADKFSFGDTLFAKYDGKACGFCALHTVMRRADMSGAAVRCIGVRPGYGEIVLEPLLSSAEDLAAEAGCPEILVAVPANRRRATDSILSRGYSVTQTLERMMWMGSSGLASGMGDNLCSWSG
ncbi:MAG: GNAT family N-acetyltransferase [Methanobacteriota archaeon]|nr:MAG: GNAT family N-acetyltransferase [Euryarchaeota archaeon]